MSYKTPTKEPDNRQYFTVYRVIRIDGQFDRNRHDDVSSVIENAVKKTISDALAHSHTIVDGIEITDVIDCGKSI